MRNLHYLFHVKYFEDLDHPAYNDDNRELISQVFRTDTKNEMPFTREEDGFTTVALRVLYPGLLLGLGYPHDLGIDAPDKDDAVKLGFSIDYTTSLPVIPGSTVKGVLRSAFRRESGADFIKSLLNKPALNVEQLEKEIFGEWIQKNKKDTSPVIAVSDRDVFFDAYPVKADRNGLIYNLENITPHIKPQADSDMGLRESEKKEIQQLYANGLKNPTPLKLLKVRPEVVFLFRFRFSQKDGQLNTEEKSKLFSLLITILGIGSKTNTGFGGMKTTPAQDKYYWLTPRP